MRWFSWLGCMLMAGMATAAQVPTVDSVAILYNRAMPESRKLAEYYRDARGIPSANLIALDMPLEQTISRQQYEEMIADPLRKEFDQRRWWRIGAGDQGVTVPRRNRIRVLVTVRGVPLRISRTPSEAPATQGEQSKKQPFVGHDEASVDSELAMLGVQNVPAAGPLKNAYYRSEKTIAAADLPFLMLTARIDAPTYATCERMIRDAIEVEKTGLWGNAYADIANKFPQGDKWLEQVVKQNLAAGIPTVVDRFNPTLPSHYPMRDAAMYFGWYDRNVSGPFLNPDFRLRRGSVAMHLHSFSAEQMRNANKNWSGALLERGAAVTIGNVYEPYLHLTHDFALLHQRLLEGFSWVEACWMSIPAASWQAVVLGDPLYQPFAHLDGRGVVADADREYRALRAAMTQWKDDPGERMDQLKKAAVRMKSGVMLEAVALESLEVGMADKATSCFLQAKDLYQDPADKLRQEIHLAAMDRRSGRKKAAVEKLREAEKRYASLPEVLAVKGWLDILDPPPPPAAVVPEAPSGQPVSSSQ